ncbi:hypothetical protein TD95_005174 [Thielaviopsis punctulata]|uniref:Glutaredoxin-like protein n=1 Tax=Thielaviopsis punctulata TaxID=72032 RepID=A0A0F4ZL09_9PEZI|nr:hypothetical protein TD95_005174 [Thielaviopsis punctulata]
MFFTSVLRRCRITLFTRTTCGLCDTAKDVLHQLQKTRPFDLEQVNLSAPGTQAWKDLYDFDVPVIHIAKAGAPPETPKGASKAVKLMHRLAPAEVEAKMDMVEAQ